MSKRTKISLGILGPGFFYLPEHIILYCPNCGERIEEKGEAVCTIVSGIDDPGGFSLTVKCKCDTVNEEPVAIKPIKNSHMGESQNAKRSSISPQRNSRTYSRKNI